VLVLSVTCIGWLFLPLNMVERGLSGVSALFLMFSGWRTDLIGLALLAVLLASAFWRYTRRRDRGSAPEFAQTGAAGQNAAPPGD
jgi:membrane protein implicated in regulation of membrane protease activity